MPVQLNQQASAALAHVIRQNNGQLPVDVEQKLKALETQQTQQAQGTQGAQQAQQPTPLTLKDIEQILVQAMPQQQKIVQDAVQIGSGYHCDGKDAQFLTKILSARVQKVDEVQAGNNTPAVPRRYDPYHAEFDMDPKAQTMLLFNARNVDRNGSALLMKVVLRMTPKVEAAITPAKLEIEDLVTKSLATMRQHNSAITEQDVRAHFGLVTDGSSDQQNINWINQVSANAGWMQQNWPNVGAAKTRVAELTKNVAEAEQRFIDDNLPKLDLTRYRREPPDAKPDVTLVGARDTYVKTADMNESEFNFGDPLKQVSLNAANKEISTSVFVQPENDQFNRAWNNPAAHTGRRTDYDRHQAGVDRQAVVTFDDRIRVGVKAKDGQQQQPGAWLDEAGGLQKLDVNVFLDRGVVFEPGSNVTVSILNTNVTSTVPNDDAQLLGNASQSQKLDTSAQNMSVRQFLQSTVRRTSWAQPNQSDAQPKDFTVAGLLYGNKDAIGVGGRTLQPLGDTILKSHELAANKMTLDAIPVDDPQKDGVKIRLKLDEGFLTADGKAASVKGYTIQVGYFDESNKWIEAKSRTVGSDVKSKAETFEFDVPNLNALNGPKDAAGNPTKRLEVRMYNADGIPAERIQIPFREAKWADS